MPNASNHAPPIIPAPGPQPPRPSPPSGNSEPAWTPRNRPTTPVKSSLTVIGCSQARPANTSEHADPISTDLAASAQSPPTARTHNRAAIPSERSAPASSAEAAECDARGMSRVATPDGHSNGTLRVPNGDGPWPGVLVFPRRQRSARDDPADGQPTGGHRARRVDPGHLPPRGPEGAVRRGHLVHRRTTPLTGCPKAHNHGQNASRVSHPNPPPPQQNHALATSRRKPANRANGLIYMALGRVRYPAKRLLQATETGSGPNPGIPRLFPVTRGLTPSDRVWLPHTRGAPVSGYAALRLPSAGAASLG